MDYSIVKPSMQQIDSISNMYWQRSLKWQQNRYNYIWYVAVDPQNNVIGYLVLEEKKVQIFSIEKDWFILTIRVLPECRCCGIGSELLKYAFTDAQMQGVSNFQGSANPTKEAHAFWLKNKFSFFQYSKKHDDPSKPDEYGNYSHMIFKRVSINEPDRSNLNCLLYETVTQDEMDCIYDNYIEKECSELYHLHKDKIVGIKAFDSQRQEVGFITWLEMPLMPPLAGKQWYTPYIYVKPEFRNMGIGRKIIEELLRRAKENKVQQVLIVHKDEDIIPYWYNLGFDILIFRYIFTVKSGKYPVGIGKNIL